MMSYSSFARKNFFVLYQKLSFAAQPLQPSSPFVAFKTLGGVDDAAECRHAVYGSWRRYRCLWCGGMCIPLFAVCHMILTSALHPTICRRPPRPDGRIPCVRFTAQNETLLRNNSLASDQKEPTEIIQLIKYPPTLFNLSHLIEGCDPMFSIFRVSAETSKL